MKLALGKASIGGKPLGGKAAMGKKKGGFAFGRKVNSKSKSKLASSKKPAVSQVFSFSLFLFFAFVLVHPSASGRLVFANTKDASAALLHRVGGSQPYLVLIIFSLTRHPPPLANWRLNLAAHTHPELH